VRTFRLQRPAIRALPLVVSVPHAGTLLPGDLDGEVIADERLVRADADLAVDELYASAPTAGATLLTATVSRFVVDLNRATSDVDALSVPDHPAPLLDARRGLIWRTATGGRSVLGRPLTLEKLRDRIARYYTPYHDALGKLIGELKDEHGYVIVLDGHSMPGFSRSEGAGAGGGGRRHADIVPGCMGGTSCAPSLVRAACEYFAGRGYSVAVDDPYRGGFITRHYGQPREGVHVLQVEVNRDLYMDPLTLELRPRGFARLRADLLAFVQQVATLRL